MILHRKKILPSEPLHPQIAKHYEMLRYFPNRGWCGVMRFAVFTGINSEPKERWRFRTREEAQWAFRVWDGKDDPPGDNQKFDF